MSTFRQHVEDALRSDEDIVISIANERATEHLSSNIILTNERIFYSKQGFLGMIPFLGSAYRVEELDNIESLSYSPKPLNSGGLVKARTSTGGRINLTPSYVGENRANELIKRFEELR